MTCDVCKIECSDYLCKTCKARKIRIKTHCVICRIKLEVEKTKNRIKVSSKQRYFKRGNWCEKCERNAVIGSKVT